MKNQEMTVKIAGKVETVWQANRDEVMDRGSAVRMLVSNLEHREREEKTMLYDCGNITPTEMVEMIDYWSQLDDGQREEEYVFICKIVEEMEWANEN